MADPRVSCRTDGKPVRVAVTLGLDDDSFTEIVGGELKPGDQVILSEQSGSAGQGTRPTVATVA